MRSAEIVELLGARTDELHHLGVRSLKLFGSASRDEAGPTSDLDFLVDFEGAPTFDRYMDLKFYLEDLFGRRVDLVTRRGLREELRPLIEREAIRVT